MPRSADPVLRFLSELQHPLLPDIEAVVGCILDADPSIQATIKWNSVSFRTPADFFATVNLRSLDAVELVFHTGVKRKPTAETGVPVADPCGLITRWMAKDRCVVRVGRDAERSANGPALAELVRAWIVHVPPAG